MAAIVSTPRSVGQVPAVSVHGASGVLEHDDMGGETLPGPLPISRPDPLPGNPQAPGLRTTDAQTMSKSGFAPPPGAVGQVWNGDTDDDGM